MGIPIADQNTELVSASRRSQQRRPSSDFDPEDQKPMFPDADVASGRPCCMPVVLPECMLMNAEPTTDDSSTKSPHFSHRAPWLRALVLGANDGLVSIASLMLGVDAVIQSEAMRATIASGVAGLIAGACSMAIGEFVSVYSQRDSELADLEIERKEHSEGPDAEARELEELTQIYVGRGLSYYLAKQVAEELSRVDALKAHARDELGIDLDELSNPTQAALASAMAFAFGGAVPLLSGSFISTYNYRLASIVTASSVALVCFGAIGARLGGANMLKAAMRVLAGGWLAMLITYGVLRLVRLIGF